MTVYYHGTSSNLVSAIVENGLSAGSYIAKSRDEAAGYAIAKAEKLGGVPTMITFEIERPENLRETIMGSLRADQKPAIKIIKISRVRVYK